MMLLLESYVTQVCARPKSQGYKLVTNASICTWGNNSSIGREVGKGKKQLKWALSWKWFAISAFKKIEKKTFW